MSDETGYCCAWQTGLRRESALRLRSVVDVKG